MNGQLCVSAFVRAVVAPYLSRTCQDNAESIFGVFTDTHLHECERECGHRSRVHRCECGVEWWEAS